MHVVSSDETINHFEELYNTMKIRYGDMKKQLAEDMILFTKPFREKIETIKNDEALLKKVAKRGAEKARESASKTLMEAIAKVTAAPDKPASTGSCSCGRGTRLHGNFSVGVGHRYGRDK